MESIAKQEWEIEAFFNEPYIPVDLLPAIPDVVEYVNVLRKSGSSAAKTRFILGGKEVPMKKIKNPTVSSILKQGSVGPTTDAARFYTIYHQVQLPGQTGFEVQFNEADGFSLFSRCEAKLLSLLTPAAEKKAEGFVSFFKGKPFVKFMIYV